MIMQKLAIDKLFLSIPTSKALMETLGHLLLEKNEIREASKYFRLDDSEKSDSFLLRCLYLLGEDEFPLATAKKVDGLRGL